MHRIHSGFVFLTIIALLVIGQHVGGIAAQAAEKKGVWELVDTKFINKVMDQDGWINKVNEHSNGRIRTSSATTDKKIYSESVGTWTIPPARLIPGQDLTLTASIKSIARKNLGYWTPSCWLWVTGLGMSGRFSTAELGNQAPVGTIVSDKRSVKIPEGSGPLGEQKGTITAKVLINGELAVEYHYIWNPGLPRTPGPKGSSESSPSPSPKAIDPHTNNTVWSVGHPTPWVFRPDGTVGAKGIWEGTWKRSGKTYHVSIVHRGATDNFTVEFDPSGKSFTAYKNGKIYRQGSRR